MIDSIGKYVIVLLWLNMFLGTYKIMTSNIFNSSHHVWMQFIVLDQQ
jgi:hypothetical protein